MRRLFYATTLLVLIFIIILGVGYFVERGRFEWPEEHPVINFPGWAPSDLGLAITPNGKTAYVSFASDDALLVVNLSTFKVIESINVSSAGNMLMSNNAVLTPDGKKLYVANMGTKNIMVIDTENRRVEKILPIAVLWAMSATMSQDGSKVYESSEDGRLYIINTSDDSYDRILVQGILFGPVIQSRKNPDLLYTVGGKMEQDGNFQPYFFIFDVSSNTIVRSSKLSSEVMPLNMFTRRFFVNSDETRAYFGAFQMDDKGSGNFNVFGLENFQVLASTPMDNGVTDFAVNEETGKVYITGFWAGGGAPQKLPVIEYDTQTNTIVRRIIVSPSSDQRAIVLDPVNDNYLYMIEGDFNLIRRIDIAAGREINSLYFNKADIQPYAIIPDGDTGYVVSRGSGDIYKLNLSSGELTGKIELPFMHSGWGFYQGNLYVSSGNKIFVVNTSDGSIIKEYPLAINFNPTFFTFFDNRMATVDFGEGMTGRKLIFFDARDMSVVKSINLPNEPHAEKVILSPDGSKLYTARGPMMGAPAVITVFNSSNLEIINTIEIPYIGIMRRGMTGFVEADFDVEKRIMYLTGFESIYKIDMDTNELVGILDLINLYAETNVWGWSPTGLSGLVLSKTNDKMFIVSGDAHSMYTYNLANSSWSTKITNLEGYFITDAVASLDKQYLYTVNEKSDSITMVNLTSGDVVKIIRL
jgi:YVTN family beta-propeller protein